jgi:rhamnosyltransferase
VAERLVVAIIPAHDPDNRFASRLDALRRQVSRVVVVDDGSREEFHVTVRDHSVVVARQENKGIAAAINSGIRVALENWPDLDFFLTVDQDSELAEDYVRCALGSFDRATERGLCVGAICAEMFNEGQVRRWRTINEQHVTLQVAQSGMLFPRATFRRFGLFNESLFIDAVDTEYALRMGVSGWFVAIGDGCRLVHQVGELVPIRIFGHRLVAGGRARSFSYHSTMRRYYITRNRLVTYRKYFSVAPGWIIFDTVAEIRTLLLSMLFAQRRWAQFGAVILGLIDGLRGRMGKRESALWAAGVVGAP